jgi:hypothetical protein
MHILEKKTDKRNNPLAVRMNTRLQAASSAPFLKASGAVQY